MRYGLLSLAMLLIAGTTILMFYLIQPGWGDPRVALGEQIIIFSFVVSLMFGITGIIFDRKKWLAIITTCINGIPVILILYSLILHVYVSLLI